jgi:hypothetical protein
MMQAEEFYDAWKEHLPESDPLDMEDTFEDLLMIVDDLEDKTETSFILPEDNSMQLLHEEVTSYFEPPMYESDCHRPETPPRQAMSSCQGAQPPMVSPEITLSMKVSLPVHFSPPEVEITALPIRVRDLQYQYKETLQKLAASMRRSEVTRSEIIRQQKLALERVVSPTSQTNNISMDIDAHAFFSGSSGTLASDLANSRHQVWSFIESHNQL